MSGDGTDVIERAYFAKEAGATANGGLRARWVWLATNLASDEKLRLPIIHHPAYSGGFVSPSTSGIADYLQLGLLPRIFGADMCRFFVSYGGRFTFTENSVSGYPTILNNRWP